MKGEQLKREANGILSPMRFRGEITSLYVHDGM